jgi:hypothetical protein
MIVGWTGHRPDLFRDPAAAEAVVDAVAREFARSDAEAFVVGGQRGVDTWAAQAANRYAVPFRLVLPFEVLEFTHDWLEADRSGLKDLLIQAASVCIAGGYTHRNRLVATSAQLLVAVWTGTSGGGTAETIDLARQAGTPVREIVLPIGRMASSAVGRGI